LKWQSKCAWWVAAAVILVAPAKGAAPKAAEDVTAILRRQTQELFDAVTAGDSTVWDRYLAPDAVYADEGGELSLKKKLVGSIKPLPKDVSGKLELTEFKVHPHGETAVTTFIANETEVYYGQEIHCRYLSTYVWMRSAGQWRVIAAQTLALREDPPAVALAPERLDEYVGDYELTPGVSYAIRRKGDVLFGQRTGRPEETLKAELADLFFVPGRPRLRKVFQRGADGKITGFVERREAWDIAWKRRGP
jgi:uncharacterized protein DUF4440/uncharacterized protein DUF3471